ncbi:precorrin-3B C(17)-methyltransferase [Vibrio vulnificus]|uniref:Precorrin-3B C(17)-methyltransferase n=1 Tax=Vibrio vulnificus TaxID=672 RepID=A0AAN1PSC8_VIBVL|nr:precorrin-3B C(17)-methyltransferase [Vibrio vulnificus]
MNCLKKRHFNLGKKKDILNWDKHDKASVGLPIHIAKPSQTIKILVNPSPLNFFALMALRMIGLGRAGKCCFLVFIEIQC